MCDVSSRFISTDAVNQATNFLQILVDTAIICVANNKHLFLFCKTMSMCTRHKVIIAMLCNIAQLNRLN